MRPFSRPLFRWATFLLALAAGAASANTAWALINPRFTPIHLVEQSRLILLLRLSPGEPAGRIAAEVRRVLRGETTDKSLLIELSTAAQQEQAKALQEKLARLGGGLALLFVGEDENKENAAFLHVHGQWLRLDRAQAAATWQMRGLDVGMEGTWAGGSDMLLRAVEYILDSPDEAEVPVAVGVRWKDRLNLGTIAGAVFDAQAIDLGGQPAQVLFVGAEQGDRLYRYDPQRKEFADVTATYRLGSKVPMWSAEHWALVDKSLQLLGELGNKYVFLPLICRTNFGNEQSMVRWVQEGNGYKYDFTLFDKYLDLAQKHMKPDVVCLYVWDRYAGEYHWAGVGEKQGRGAIVTRFDPATGKSDDLEGPLLGTAEAEKFWEPVFREVRVRLQQRGLLEATMLGMNGDAYRPTDAMAKMFQGLMPGTKWISNSHADARGSRVAGIPVGYNTAVYVNLFPPPTRLSWDAGRKCGWRLPSKTDLFTRSCGPATRQPLYHTQHLGAYRLTVEAALLANYSGLGRAGFDFWPVLGKDAIRGGVKHSATVAARYPPCWDQLNIDRATENLVAPGPAGPIPTERFENVREGMLEAEARIFLEQALLDPQQRAKLGEELAAKLQTILDQRAWGIRAACVGGTCYEAADSEPLREELFTAAAEAAKKLGGS